MNNIIIIIIIIINFTLKKIKVIKIIIIIIMMMMTYAASFHEVCQHYDHGDVLFPDHSPEVVGRTLHGTLCGNVFTLAVETLHAATPHYVHDKNTPTHVFFHISTENVYIYTKFSENV